MAEKKLEERNTQTQNLIFKISEALFKYNMSIWDWLSQGKIHSSKFIGIKENPRTLIRDKVIDGHEYQLIRRENFFDALEEIGIYPSLRDKDNLKHVLGTTFLDFVDLKSILNIFSKLGIHEDIPEPTRMLNFDIFQADCIRIYNRIIHSMEKEQVQDVQDWLSADLIEPFQIVSRDREHNVPVIYVKKFHQFLCDKQILSFGEELNEYFVEFLELSPHHDHLIMLKKLKKSLEIVNSLLIIGQKLKILLILRSFQKNRSHPQKVRHQQTIQGAQNERRGVQNYEGKS